MDNTSEQSNNICLLTSTLKKVTEEFLSSVEHLQDTDNQHEQISSIMDNYNKLNLVMKVFKIAYPLKENPSKTTNIVNTSNSTSSPSKPKTIIKTPSTNQPNITKEHKSIDNTSKTTSTIVETTSTKNKEVPGRIQHKKEEVVMSDNISSNIFLDQFENTAKEFGAQHNMDISQVWESLLIHALPEDKIEWANRTLFNKGLDWKTARQLYVNAYPDIQLKKSPKKPFKPSLIKKTTDMARINQPSHNLVPTTNEAKERQARYAEYLLSIEMKAYDSIADFNGRFYRYASAACMNLNDFSLSKRYVSSLLPKYRPMVEEAIQKTPPHNLDETMNIATSVITPLETAQRISGEVCWKHPDTTKRNNLQDASQPLKRFCA